MAEGQFIAFFIAISILTMVPGADTVMVLRNSLRGGFRDGSVTSLGICSGLFVHAVVSAGGLSLILLGSAKLFTAVKLVGAGYLIWLGLISARNALRGPAAGFDVRASAAGFSVLRSLREGFLSNVLNPKTILFYMAFLPQFMDPHKGALGQAVFMAGIHFVIAMIWQCLLAAMVDRARLLLASGRVRRALDGVTSAVLVGLGLRLALEELG
ncbi:LysE family translocator [Salidesulfovibrio onnuriiensis]|uniref:LysE family translocator n=1 Tax=Salidesulfovibrio onnuriiensis TaxID=2583823 RepID=UPI0011CBEDF8|nr:LysE family translocator [Salidesulfovibrio onnuriiensis]